jgi:hypothetical protein
LIVKLWGKPETWFGVSTNVEFSFQGTPYASPAQAQEKICFCLVFQAACVFSGSYESVVEIREAIPACNPKQEIKNNPPITQIPQIK